MKKNEPYVRISTSIARNAKISPMAKALYMAIKSYDPSFPSYRKLCQDTGIKSKTTLRKYLLELQDLLLVKINRAGFNQSNHYEILPSPFYEQVHQNMSPTVPNSELTEIQNLESNKNKLNISNKSLADSSAFASEEPQGRLLDEVELSSSLSEIIKSIG